MADANHSVSTTVRSDTRPATRDGCPLTTHHRSLVAGRGQASLEMALALAGALILLFGSVKFFLWITERLVVRQVRYEQSRVFPGGSAAVVLPQEPTRPLRLLNEN